MSEKSLTLEQAINVISPDGFKKYSDLKAENHKPTEWIVENLLARSSTSIFSAPPKVGKSTLARQLALCVTTGSDFFNRKTIKGKVLFYAIEELQYEVIQHIQKMSGALSLHDEGELFFSFDPPSGDVLKNLEETIEKEKPDLVILDPLVFWMSGIKDGNDYGENYRLISKINEIAKNENTHILAIHHSRKGEGHPFEKILGSTALPAAFFTIMVTEEDENGERFYATRQKAGVWFQRSKLDFNQENGLFSITDVEAKTPNQIDEEKVLNGLITAMKPVSETEIWKTVPMKTTRRSGVLNRLLKTGQITRSGVGTKGNPYFYSLPEKREVGSTMEADENSTSLFPHSTSEEVTISEGVQ